MDKKIEVDKAFSKELQELRERYRKALEELKKENKMDKGVIRIKDGKEGVLVVEQDYYRSFGYDLKFYPITKAGKVSQKASGWNLHLTEFKPKDEKEESSGKHCKNCLNGTENNFINKG